MCLALPARVVALEAGTDQATVDLGGVRKAISLALTPEAVVGDYVIVHVGHAIGMVDADEAERTLALFAELAASQEATLEAAAADTGSAAHTLDATRLA